VAKALDHAHSLSIVHRDIKPDNIFLQRVHDETVVKVLDFGVAKDIGLGAYDHATSTGALLGTPGYMSPEQIVAAKDVDRQADLWALAVIAYECLVGRPPFDAATVGALIVAITRITYPAPSRLGLGHPPVLDGWFARAFAPSTAARFESARSMVEELARCLATAPVSLTEVATPLLEPPQKTTTPMGAWQAPAPPRTLEPLIANPTMLEPTKPVGPAIGPNLTQLDPASARTFAGASATIGGTANVPRSGRLGVVVACALGLAGLTGIVILVLTREADRPGQRSAAVLPEPAPSTSKPAGPTHASSKPHETGLVAETMVAVPAGSYPMGCPERDSQRCFSDEKPAHSVALGPFAIMRREVTVAEFQSCVRSGHCPKPGDGKGCSSTGADAGEEPVRCVGWQAARKYCEQQGWRLPTEEQWEAAARGTDGRSFPWGEDPPSCKRGAFGGKAAAGCAHGGPLPVGSRAEDRSWIGVLDMGGSVREWTDSDYRPYPGGTVEAGVTGKVNRGGSWVMAPEKANTSHTRVVDDPGEARPDLGFRCAMELGR
jgi:serine/threonine-protein kinase